MEMPALEVQLGARLSRLKPASSALHGSGHVAQGLGLVALGRPAAALAHFDSAAPLLGDSAEARLQAAEWRVLAPALGVSGMSPSEIEGGVRSLEQREGERPAWALALAYASRGDTAGSTRWAGRVGSDTPFGLMLQAMAEAQAGRFDEALRVSEPALAFDSAGRAGDPFFRAVLHLKRGEWQEASGDSAGADASWVWYEGLDVIGWPGGVVQAGEVDWALGPYVRLRRSGILAGRDPRQSCRLVKEALAAWDRPEPAIAALAAEAGKRAEKCP